MRLLTYQQLCCVRKDCQHTYPLTLHITTTNPAAVESVESDCSEKFIHNIISQLDYPLIVKTAATQFGIDTLPPTPPSQLTTDFCAELHTVLMDIHVMDGWLQCDKCERKYPIQSGIPNMRLNEDEV